MGTKSGKTVERAIRARLLIPPVSFFDSLRIRLNEFFFELKNSRFFLFRFLLVYFCFSLALLANSASCPARGRFSTALATCLSFSVRT